MTSNATTASTEQKRRVSVKRLLGFLGFMSMAALVMAQQPITVSGKIVQRVDESYATPINQLLLLGHTSNCQQTQPGCQTRPARPGSRDSYLMIQNFFSKGLRKGDWYTGQAFYVREDTASDENGEYPSYVYEPSDGTQPSAPALQTAVGQVDRFGKSVGKERGVILLWDPTLCNQEQIAKPGCTTPRTWRRFSGTERPCLGVTTNTSVPCRSITL
jgi:hypothetical protein